MIVPCPSCKTRFLVEDIATYKKASRFHCNRCGHLWFNEKKRSRSIARAISPSMSPSISSLGKYLLLLTLLALLGGLGWAVIYPYRVQYALNIFLAEASKRLTDFSTYAEALLTQLF